MPGAKKLSTNNTPKKENKSPTKKLKKQDDLAKEASITPRKRKAPEPSPNVTPVKSLKQNTPLKKKQKLHVDTPQKDEKDPAVKIARFDDTEIEVIKDMKQPLYTINEDDDDDETLEAFSVRLVTLWVFFRFLKYIVASKVRM